MLSLRRYQQPLDGGYSIELCDLWIGDVVNFPHAHISSELGHSIVLQVCLQRGYCGTPICAVRSYGNSIIWLLDSNSISPDAAMPYQFSKEDYRSALGALYADPPPMSKADLVPIIARLHVPDWRTGLFREPAFEADPSGHVLLRRCQEFLAGESGELSLCATPSQATKVSVALDTTPLSWCAVEFAVEGETVSLCFQQNPQVNLSLAAKIIDQEALADWSGWFAAAQRQSSD